MMMGQSIDVTGTSENMMASWSKDTTLAEIRDTYGNVEIRTVQSSNQKMCTKYDLMFHLPVVTKK